MEIKLKNSLINSAKRALLGNVNSSIKAIAAGVNADTLIVKCYTSRIPTAEDYESVSDISGEMISDFYYDKLEEACEFLTKPVSELEETEDMIFIIL